MGVLAESQLSSYRPLGLIMSGGIENRNNFKPQPMSLERTEVGTSERARYATAEDASLSIASARPMNEQSQPSSTTNAVRWQHQ